MEPRLIELPIEVDVDPQPFVWLTRSVIVGVIVGIVSAVQVVYSGLHFF